jgi:hypothetical protein
MVEGFQTSPAAFFDEDFQLPPVVVTNLWPNLRSVGALRAGPNQFGCNSPAYSSCIARRPFIWGNTPSDGDTPEPLTNNEGTMDRPHVPTAGQHALRLQNLRVIDWHSMHRTGMGCSDRPASTKRFHARAAEGTPSIPAATSSDRSSFWFAYRREAVERRHRVGTCALVFGPLLNLCRYLCNRLDPAHEALGKPLDHTDAT